MYLLFFLVFICIFSLIYNIINYHITLLLLTIISCFYVRSSIKLNIEFYVFIYLYINFFWIFSINFNFIFNILSFKVFFIYLLLKMANIIKNIINDIRYLYVDFYFYFSGFVGFLTKPLLFINNVKLLLTQFNDRRRYILKKYVYTINHKRIAMNYFFFSMWTALSGAALATMIRMELAFPGSPFFKGDSTRYLQTITAHGLIMVFFVVVPVLFGGFANFLIPYHVGSKDVAYPRLNSIGFWIQPFAFFTGC